MRETCCCLLIISALAFSACKRTLLDERFHDDRLVNWTVVDDPDTLEGRSVWRVEKDGWLVQKSNIWGRPGDFLGRWYGTFLVAGDEDWDDYALSVRARPIDNDGFGVAFRLSDPEHFYRLVFIQDGMSGGPLTRLDKRDGADYTELWSARTGFRPEAEMLIEVEVTGEKIRASVDGRGLFEVNDSSYPRGKIGLFSYAQEGQAFDNVTVTER
ncbi:MAG TPA: hypothetical protein VE262_00115 [Blastocatellia bacterium]|nr:hypothetical protein [Blastocatellia bacterium]